MICPFYLSGVLNRKKFIERHVKTAQRIGWGDQFDSPVNRDGCHAISIVPPDVLFSFYDRVLNDGASRDRERLEELFPAYVALFYTVYEDGGD